MIAACSDDPARAWRRLPRRRRGTVTGSGSGAAGAIGTAGTGGAPEPAGQERLAPEPVEVRASGTAGTEWFRWNRRKRGLRDGGTAPPPPTDAGPSDIPTPTGVCPDFVQGDVTFNPPEVKARTVAMTLTDASRTISGGPLIFYWFATGSNPTEASRGCRSLRLPHPAESSWRRTTLPAPAPSLAQPTDPARCLVR
jgi:hypothetical protein